MVRPVARPRTRSGLAWMASAMTFAVRAAAASALGRMMTSMFWNPGAKRVSISVDLCSGYGVMGWDKGDGESGCALRVVGGVRSRVEDSWAALGMTVGVGIVLVWAPVELIGFLVRGHWL